MRHLDLSSYEPLFGGLKPLKTAGLAILISILCGGSGAAIAVEAPFPKCANVAMPTVLLAGQGGLESIAFDKQGRLLFSNMKAKSLVRLDEPNAQPVTVAPVTNPGGIAVVNEHEAYIGTGNFINGLFPNLALAGIAHVDLDTGVVTPKFKGLSMANGMVRASDGTFYASDDLAQSLDRVLADGTVQRGWLPLNSNGLVLSRDEKTLYVNQMLPAKVLAVDRASGKVTVVADVPEARKWTWLDGLDIDQQGRLYVVAYWGGEIWRLEPSTGAICVLVDGLSLPSAVAVGHAGGGFAATSVYVTTHSGDLLEVPNAVPSAP
jgi:sugar lactone lactonase YvrE